LSLLRRRFVAVISVCFALIAGGSVAQAATLDFLGVRWQKSELTVLVKAGRGVSDSARDDVIKAIGDWNEKICPEGPDGTTPCLKLLDSGKSADVVIQMKVGGGTVLGQTLPKTSSPFTCYLKGASIQLSGKAFGQSFSNAGTRNVARHELGHVFGLGHNSDPNDLMYATADSADIYGNTDEPISQCDVDGLHAIYSAPSCNEIPDSINCP
jgi:predicted Zn-dependent protease